MSRFRYIIFILMITGFVQSGWADPSGLKVKYVSADHVYLDGGSSVGLTVGHECKILRGNNIYALLKVVYVTQRSASCEIISAKGPVLVGDAVTYMAEIQKQEIKESKIVSRKRKVLEKAKKKKSKKTRISGSLSLQLNQFSNVNNHDFDYTQPGMRLRFSARDLWGKNYHLRIKFRSRYYDRTNRSGRNLLRDEWRNRLYEVSFSYDNPDAIFNYKAGRIISRAFSGVGYIDGLQVNHNVAKIFKWGMFAGSQPTWQYSKFQTKMQKYGVFSQFTPVLQKGRYFETVLSLAGEYHNGIISREFLYLKNNLNWLRQFSLYQSLELEINRNWRKEKSGKSLTVSGLYLNGRYNFSRELSAGVSYDNRKNYRTYRIRSLADSLFNEAARQGLRSNVSYRFLKRFRIMANLGTRWRSAENDPSLAYSMGLNARNMMLKGLTLQARYSGFSNPYTEGKNTSFSVYKSFSAGHYLQLNYGNYLYDIRNFDQDQTLHWIRMNTQIELPLRLYIYSNYEYHWGDERKGHLIFTELGYRF